MCGPRGNGGGGRWHRKARWQRPRRLQFWLQRQLLWLQLLRRLLQHRLLWLLWLLWLERLERLLWLERRLQLRRLLVLGRRRGSVRSPVGGWIPWDPRWIPGDSTAVGVPIVRVLPRFANVLPAVR